MLVESGFYCSLDSVPPKKYNDGASNIKTDEYSMEEGAWGNFSRGAVLALQKKGYKLSQVRPVPLSIQQNSVL